MLLDFYHKNDDVNIIILIIFCNYVTVNYMLTVTFIYFYFYHSDYSNGVLFKTSIQKEPQKKRFKGIQKLQFYYPQSKNTN